MKLKKFLTIFAIFSITFFWMFFGFPRISQNPPLPPEIQKAQAEVNFVNTAWNRVQPGTSVSATFNQEVEANNLIVAICAAFDSSILSVDGFESAVNLTGTPSQGIFYKIAEGGEMTVVCQSSSETRLGIHIYEYSGIDSSFPLDAVGWERGSSAAPSSGSVNTLNANNLLVAGIVLNANTVISGWTNNFTERNNFFNTGAAVFRSRYGGADRIVNSVGTYETSVSARASGNWLGQIVSFRAKTEAFPATWKEDEDIPASTGKEENIRLRILIANATGSAASDRYYLLEYSSKNGEICGDDETFVPVPVNSVAEHFEMSDSYYFTDGDPTTPKLTAPENYNFVSGRMVESPSNISGNITLPVAGYTEIEFVFKAKNDAAGIYCFRLTDAGIPFDEYSVYPELEITP